MKKYNKRKIIITVLMLAILVSILLTACTNTGSGSADNTNDNTADETMKIDNAETQPVNPAETVPPVVENIDLVPDSIEDGLEGYILAETAALGRDLTEEDFVIPPQFADAGGFYEGLACVGVFTSDGIKYGYIKSNGEFVIEPKYSNGHKFSNGLACVVEGRNNYYINRFGDIIIDLTGRADGGGPFSEDGTAIVMSIDEENQAISKSALIDRNGNFLIGFDKNLRFISDASIDGYRTASPLYALNGFEDTGVIDLYGNWVIDPKYYNVKILEYDRVYINYANIPIGTGTSSRIINFNENTIAELGHGECYWLMENVIIYNKGKGQNAELIIYDFEGNLLLDGEVFEDSNVLAQRLIDEGIEND